MVETDSQPMMADYAAFLVLLRARGDVDFITYDDLDWGDDVDYRAAYPGEWQRWCRGVRARPGGRSRVQVLLQHDTDSGPAATIDMARIEEAFGARSSIMTFARIPRKIGAPEVDDYVIDWAALKSLQERGFCVGYHCNAFHLANFAGEHVGDEFIRDVGLLEAHGLRIDQFTVHGGKAGADGRINSSFDYPALTGTRLRWVNTRFGPQFDGGLSDGGSGKSMTGAQRLEKLTAFVARMRPGCRYRMLIHAQCYRRQDLAGLMSLLPPWPEAAAHGVTSGAVIRLERREPLAARLRTRARNAVRDAFGGTALYHLVLRWRQRRARARTAVAAVAR